MSRARGSAQSEAGASAFPLEHGEIEAERVADHHAAVDEGRELWPYFRKWRGTGHRGVVDAVDAGRRGGYRTGRPDPASQRGGGFEPSADEPYGSDLDQRCPARIEARGLGIDRHRVEGDERRGATLLPHRLLRFDGSAEADGENKSDQAPTSISSSSRIAECSSLHVVVLTAAQRPEEGGEPREAEQQRHGHEINKHVHGDPRIRRARKALTGTRSEEPDRSNRRYDRPERTLIDGKRRAEW